MYHYYVANFDFYPNCFMKLVNARNNVTRATLKQSIMTPVNSNARNIGRAMVGPKEYPRKRIAL